MRATIRSFILLAFTAGLAQAASQSNSPTQSPDQSEFQTQTDGFKYADVASSTEAVQYSQMWYFNFVDDENDLAGIVGVGVLNPGQRFLPTGQTSTIIGLVRRPEDGKSFYLWNRLDGDLNKGLFFASPSFMPDAGSQLMNPSLSIKVLSPDQYLLLGCLQKDGQTICLNLTYTRATEGLGQGWIPWNNIELPKVFGLLDARVTYTMQMPNAVVNGSITVIDKSGTKKYAVKNARGYHDGYFGSASLITTFKWDWLNYQQNDLAVQMLNPHAPDYKCQGTQTSCLPGNLRVLVKQAGQVKSYEFSKKEITIQYNEMKIDPEFPSVPYPTDTTITAVDAQGNRLTLNWKTRRYVKVFYNPPKPLKNLPTFEIVAEMEGIMTDAQSGDSTPIHGTGWADYSN